jgi:5'/3'-nucleotidase SurE
MRPTPALALALLPLAHAIDIVSSNDDGWAEANIRSIYSALTSSGHSVVVSAPAENKSGSGMRSLNDTTIHLEPRSKLEENSPSNSAQAPATKNPQTAQKHASLIPARPTAVQPARTPQTRA